MSLLLLPEDKRDLLFVSACDEQDINGMVIINQAGADWLAGKLDTGTYFDVLDHFGIDPFLHVNAVEDFAFNTTFEISLLL